MSTRRQFLIGAASVAGSLALAACGSTQASSSSDPIIFGVSGPFTGNNAEYGQTWKKAWALVLEDINGKGGINGRKVQLNYQDSQADPKQSVLIAQKFADDSTILAELGDFASPASMAASSIYQRAKLVQFGFTNSHPKFTLGGDAERCGGRYGETGPERAKRHPTGRTLPRHRLGQHNGRDLSQRSKVAGRGYRPVEELSEYRKRFSLPPTTSTERKSESGRVAFVL